MARPPGSQGRCSVCGMYGHIARHGECSKAQKARRLVAGGFTQYAAAKRVGLSEQNVSDAVRRRRGYLEELQ